MSNFTEYIEEILLDVSRLERKVDQIQALEIKESAVTGGDHGGLTGLGDDDHTIYLLADGTRALTADWDAGAFDILADQFAHSGDTDTYVGMSDDAVDIYAGGVRFITFTEDVTQNTIVLNEGQADIDFRIESDTDTHAFFLEASDGQIGVGTDSPQSHVDIRAMAGSAGTLTLSTAETTVVDGDKLGQINFQAPDEGSGTDAILVGASIWAEADAEFSTTVNATDLVFATGASETAVEQMRLTSDGLLGIKTDTPTEELHVAGDMRLTGGFYDSNNAAGTSGQILSSTGTATDWIDAEIIASGTTAGNTLRWTGSAWAESGMLYNDTTGVVVGGGTDSEGLLTVETANIAGHAAANAGADELILENNGDTGMTIRSNATGTALIAFDDTVALRGYVQYQHSTDALSFGSAGTLQMTIDSAGDVAFTSGTLTANSNTIWHAGNDGAGSGLDADLLDAQSGAYYLDSANFTGTNWTDLTDGGDTTLHTHTSDVADGTTTHSTLRWSGSAWVESTDLVNSDSGVAIGTTTIEGLLHLETANVSGHAAANAGADELILENSTDTGMTIRSGTTGTGLIAFDDTVALRGYVQYQHSTDAMSFGSAGTLRMTINSSGDIVVAGTTITAGGNTVWHAGNDGAGSGLDADLLDAQSGAYYLDSANFTGTNWTDLTDGGETTLHTHASSGVTGSGAADQVAYWTGASTVSGSSDFTWDNTAKTMRISGNAPLFEFRESDQTLPVGLWRIAVDAGNWRIDRNTAAGGDFSTSTAPFTINSDDAIDFVSGTITANSNTVWHAGNDGAGSGLDADLLDGQSGAYYLDSANFTGTNWTDLTDSGSTTLHTHSGIPASGGTTHSTLRWSGSAWVESTELVNSDSGVAIGTTTIEGMLHIESANVSGHAAANAGADELILENSGDTGMTIRSGTTGTALIAFDDTVALRGYIQYQHSTDAMSFGTGGGLRGYIDSGGDWGFGNTSPTQKVHVTGNMRVTGGYYDSNNDVGTSGQVLSSTGSGTDWIDAASGTPGGSNTEVQFNDSGSFGGDPQFTWNKTTNTLTVDGQILLDNAGAAEFKMDSVAPFFEMTETGAQTTRIVLDNDTFEFRDGLSLDWISKTLNGNADGDLIINNSGGNFTVGDASSVTTINGTAVTAGSATITGSLLATKSNVFHDGDSDTYLGFSTNRADLYAGAVRFFSAVETTQDEAVINEDQADVDFRVESDTATHAFFLQASDGKIGVNTSSPDAMINVVDSSTPTVYIENTGSGYTAVVSAYKGILLTSGTMDTTNEFTPGLMFGSTDGAFTTTNPKHLAGIYGRATEAYTANDDGGMALHFATSPNNAGIAPDPIVRMYIEQDGSIVVGNPTGGAKGIGTINAHAVYDDNVLLTDHVFEVDYEMLSVSDMQKYFEEHKHLPTIPGRETWEEEGKFSLGKIVTHLWETIEVQAKYIAGLHERVSELESA